MSFLNNTMPCTLNKKPAKPENRKIAIIESQYLNISQYTVDA